MANDEKLEYINAELCLMKKPANLGLPGARTRFDELQAIHQLQAYATHFVVSRSPSPSLEAHAPGQDVTVDNPQGAFLPFHRMMMLSHENALRNECNYTGYQP